MKILTHFVFVLFSCFIVQGQTLISGTILSKNKAISGASVSLVGTYDGATTNAEGYFSFATTEKGKALLLVEHPDFETLEKSVIPNKTPMVLHLVRKTVVTLETFEFVAGQHSTKSGTNKATLQPLDIVTTAGAMGDNIGALQKLPGTQNNAEDGRLFVRGGSPDETSTFIDGMKVYRPYTISAPQSTARSRFSPFLFKGIHFSTGGYGATFGNALSGILDLQTIDFPKENKADLSISTVGSRIALNQNWKNKSLILSTEYSNLALYNALFKTRDQWLHSPEKIASEAMFHQKKNKTIWKTYAAYDFTKLKQKKYHLNAPKGEILGIQNHNLYINSSVKSTIATKTKLLLGGSFSKAKTKLTKNKTDLTTYQQGAFGRIEIQSKRIRNLKVKTGISIDYERVHKKAEQLHLLHKNSLQNAYLEGEWKLSPSLGVKAGLRYSYSSALKKGNWLPRLSLAYQWQKQHSLSFAYGRYAQLPAASFLGKTSLNFEKAAHFLLNYLYQGKRNSLHIKGYHKNYTDLLTYTKNGADKKVENKGFGQATGLDFFWRNDKDLVSGLDFWISYSYIHSKRNYRTYPTEATPPFVPEHTANWVGKYFVTSLRSQLSLTYTFSSGRTYTNKNTIEFLNEKTKNYHSVDIGWAYLLSPQKILYIGINNVFNIKNEFGYRYANQANASHFFEREPILAQNNQFFYIGFYWTLSRNKKRNQLNQL